MKFKTAFALSSILFITLFSCKKESAIQKNSLSLSSNSESVATAISKWFGIYVEGSGYGLDTVEDVTFISNGVAKLTNSPYSYYYTNIQLPIKGRTISGDSITLVSRFKNPSAGGITDYDATMTIEGTKNVAHVTFIGYRAQYTSLGVGTAQITNVPELVHIFEDFTTVSLKIKNNTISVYMNGILTKSTSINNEEVGNIKDIQVSFKGSGTVDWVRMVNSYTGAPVMLENFNLTHSNVKWF